jgi:hypothetical protein
MSLATALPTSTYRPNKVGFLVHVGRHGAMTRVTHIWDGDDTACRMWSTGGLNHSHNWEYHIAPAIALCINCTRNHSREFGAEALGKAHLLASFRRVGVHFRREREAFLESGGNLDESPF